MQRTLLDNKSMVMEQNMQDMFKRLESDELKEDMHKRNTDDLEARVKDFNDMKDSFGDQLASRLANIEGGANIMDGR